MASTRTGEYRRALIRVQRASRTWTGLKGRAAAANRARLPLMTVAAVKYYQNRHVESIEWCHRAIREAKRGGAKDALADAYKVLDLAHSKTARSRRRPTREALRIYEELGDLRNQAPGPQQPGSDRP